MAWVRSVRRTLPTEPAQAFWRPAPARRGVPCPLDSGVAAVWASDPGAGSGGSLRAAAEPPVAPASRERMRIMLELDLDAAVVDPAARESHQDVREAAPEIVTRVLEAGMEGADPPPARTMSLEEERSIRPSRIGSPNVDPPDPASSVVPAGSPPTSSIRIRSVSAKPSVVAFLQKSTRTGRPWVPRRHAGSTPRRRVRPVHPPRLQAQVDKPRGLRRTPSAEHDSIVQTRQSAESTQKQSAQT